MAEEFNTNILNVAVDFVKKLNVPFNKHVFKNRLKWNRHYPSMYGLSEVFNEYNIENKGLKVKPKQLDELPLPFLAFIKIKEINSEDFVNVISINADSVTYYYNGEETISRDDFIKNWKSNIVFLAESDEKSGEKDFEKNRKIQLRIRNRIYIWWTGFILILFYSIFRYAISSGNILMSSVAILLTLLGLVISILFLIYETDKSNTFVKSICTGGVKTNCDAVLSSKAAKLFGVSWSEIGFFYFFTLLLFLLIPGVPFKEKIAYISYLYVLSAFYMPFSIYYQYKIVKQWCPLCLIVQIIILINLFLAILLGDFNINLSITNIIFFISCAITPVLCWSWLKPIIIKSKEASKIFAVYKRLVSRQDIFDVLMTNQPDAPEGWQNMGVSKGNPDAEIVIIKVCSPSCGHCDTAHRIFNELLSINNNIRLVTLYNITNKENDDRRFPVKHFLALEEKGDDKQTQKAMDYWYLNDNRNYETLKNKFPLTQDELDKQVNKIEEMAAWCKIAEISYTPTIFINEKKLPSNFSLPDLMDIFY